MEVHIRQSFAPEVHCDCDACTEGAKKKCNGVEKLPYAPTVQVMGNDMVWRCKGVVVMPIPLHFHTFYYLYTVGVSGVSGAKKRKETRASHQP